ncbi:SDR family oxidoreductase [Chitinophaga sp. 212800010-3]|uniref:SDR family NAD(P)-dependent oxidoreductase n=1 Tax=unclassified Chitinophaga TaxID=2619133 RepID=UPI002DEA56E7|nr:SDR family oxidoreductase [Chitinophaga sp. 212800010-3]
MNLQLENKNVFISGSTQGIGFAIAQKLLSEGAHVIINGRHSQKVNSSVEKLTSEFPAARVSGIAADFSKVNEIENLLHQLPKIDVLVNNIGIFNIKPFADISDDEWEEIFQVNVMSGVRLSRKIMHDMLERNWGRIIFISSESAINVPADMIHYGMTKTAMLAVSNGLSKLTKGTAVTVNTILGGPVYSEGVATAVEHIATTNGLPVNDIKNQIMKTNKPDSLIDRFIETSEIANVVSFLASPLSVAINGAAIRVDGGAVNTI